MGDLFAPSHIIIILIVALLLFGPKKLPELGRGFGSMLREFKRGANGIVNPEEPVQKVADQPAEPAEQLPAPPSRIKLP